MIKPYEDDIKECMKVFTHHGVILYPTDTIWGLGCRADDKDAIEKIFRIKQRPAQQSFILLVTDLKQLNRYVASAPPHLDEMLSAFTTPTTVIYPSAINLPSSLVAADGSIGIRITADPFCRSLIKRMRVPLVSTSANISGEPNPTHFSQMNPDILNGVDHVVKWRQEENTPAKPSSIYRWDENGQLNKIR